MKTRFQLAAGAAALAIGGCNGPGGGGSDLPDLTPIKPFPDILGPVGYCDTQNGSLRVGVLNHGNTAAAAKVEVDFLYTAIDPPAAMTALIPPGESRSVLIPIPTPIPPGDYDFKITVDPDDAVKEPLETNNEASGHCLT